MARYSQETTINASPDAVFAYVSDMTKHGEWGSHQVEVKPMSSGPAGVGSTFESTQHQFGTHHEQQTITVYEPAHRLVFQATGALGLAEHSFDLSPQDGATKVSKSMELVKPTFLAKLMSMKISSDQKKGLAEDLRRIKAKLESSNQ